VPQPFDNEQDEGDRIDLHPEHLSCPRCGADLLRVDHAPDYADRLFYCTDCPRRAEVSFEDPVYAWIVAEKGATPDRFVVLHAVEQYLRPCQCGGCFQHDAPRRCSECGEIVLAGEPDVDLWPGYCDFDMERHLPSPEVVERINAFDADYIRRTQLWDK
jgi:hypothetical protein